MNLNDQGTAAQNKSYRLTGAGLTPITESLKAVALAYTTDGTFSFNVDIQFHY